MRARILGVGDVGWMDGGLVLSSTNQLNRKELRKLFSLKNWVWLW